MSTQTLQAPSATALPSGTWDVDPTHSSVEFQVRNMGIVTVKGFFDRFAGTIEYDGNGGLQASGSAEAASVHTRSEKRDEHLRAPDFFDVEAHPELTFVSTGIEPTSDGYQVTGDLTIKGITREVTFDAQPQGTTSDPWGGERIGLAARAEVDRRDFDLNWDVTTPGGIPLASHRVVIEVHLGATRRQ
jgi:polyisoprenoid-binding protein YceI